MPVVAPVFVDDSGRRRRLLVAAALVVAVLCLALIGLLWLSQLGSGGDLDLGSSQAVVATSVAATDPGAAVAAPGESR